MKKMNKLLKQNSIMIIYIVKLIDYLENETEKMDKIQNFIHVYEFKKNLLAIKDYLEQCLKECNE